MKLSYRNRLIIASAIVVVLAAIAFVALIVPQFGTLSDLDSRIEDAEMGVSQAQALLTQRQSIKARAAETEATRMRLANQIPETPELPSLIVELQDTINASGLEFASIAPNPPMPVTDEQYSAIDMAITVRGSWQDTVDLLNRFRSLTRQVRVVSFSVTRLDPGTEAPDDTPNRVESAISLQVYTMPSDVAPPAPVTPDDAQTPDETQ